jgi:hypothetical protein
VGPVIRLFAVEDDADECTFEIEFLDPGVRAYAFTFG